MKNFRCILIFIVSLIIIYAVCEDQSCNTPLNRQGVCIDLDGCSRVSNIYENKKRTRDDTVYLKDSACGFNIVLKKLKVCCELVTIENGSNCTTPKLEAGVCISLFDCPSLLTLSNARHQLAEDKKKLLTESTCRGSHPFSVCCSDNIPQNVVDLQSSVFLPPRPNCGREATVHKATEVVDGESALDQFPWLAAIEYKDVSQDNDKSYYYCSATLISSRYVLTGSQCFYKSNMRKKVPKNVVLGEYDFTTAKDCDANRKCNDESLKIAIEDIIQHPNFDAKTVRNDIALVRMNRDVEFTDFIRPLCLPQTNIFEIPPNIRVNLIISGWYLYFDGIQRSKPERKLNLRVHHVKNSDCQIFYNENNFTLMQEHICAGGVTGKSSCNGDAGIPLMRFRNDQYELIGILAFGAKQCGSHVPDIYTNVYSYIDWIRNNVKK